MEDLETIQEMEDSGQMKVHNQELKLEPEAAVSETTQKMEDSGLMKVRSQELIQGLEAAVSEMMWELKKVLSEMPHQKEK